MKYGFGIKIIPSQKLAFLQYVFYDTHGEEIDMKEEIEIKKTKGASIGTGRHFFLYIYIFYIPFIFLFLYYSFYDRLRIHFYLPHSDLFLLIKTECHHIALIQMLATQVINHNYRLH